MFVLLLLVQLYKFKIIRIAACFLIVKSIDAHVCLLQFLGSIVEGVGGVLLGCHCHNHFRCEDGAVCTFDAFRLYLKHLTHSNLFIGSYFSCHADCGISCQRAKIEESSELYKSIMIHKRKKNGVNSFSQHFLVSKALVKPVEKKI